MNVNSFTELLHKKLVILDRLSEGKAAHALITLMHVTISPGTFAGVLYRAQRAITGPLSVSNQLLKYSMKLNWDGTCGQPRFEPSRFRWNNGESIASAIDGLLVASKSTSE